MRFGSGQLRKPFSHHYTPLRTIIQMVFCIFSWDSWVLYEKNLKIIPKKTTDQDAKHEAAGDPPCDTVYTQCVSVCVCVCVCCVLCVGV